MCRLSAEIWFANIIQLLTSLSVIVQADEGDGDEEAGMEVDAADTKQVYKPAKLAPVYYGQHICISAVHHHHHHHHYTAR